MASRAGVITKWLVAWLNDPARDWPRIEGDQWEAERLWQPSLQLEESSTRFTVQVSADSRSSNELVNRVIRQRDLMVFIDFRQRYGQPEAIPDAWLDERVQLVETIDDALLNLELTNVPTGTLLASTKQLYVASSTIDPLCDRIDLDQLRQFSATIELAIRECKTA